LTLHVHVHVYTSSSVWFLLLRLRAVGPGLTASPMRTPELECVGRSVAKRRVVHVSDLIVKERSASVVWYELFSSRELEWTSKCWCGDEWLVEWELVWGGIFKRPAGHLLTLSSSSSSYFLCGVMAGAHVLVDCWLLFLKLMNSSNISVAWVARSGGCPRPVYYHLKNFRKKRIRYMYVHVLASRSTCKIKQIILITNDNKIKRDKHMYIYVNQRAGRGYLGWWCWGG
jgi:hypothetical protein